MHPSSCTSCGFFSVWWMNIHQMLEAFSGYLFFWYNSNIFESPNLQIGVAWCCSTVSIHECRINDAIEIVFATSHDHQLIVCHEPLSFQQPCHLVLQTPKLVAVHPNCMLSNDVLCVHHCMIWIPLKNIYADRMQKVDPCPRDPGNLRTFTRLRRAMHWL